MTAPKKAAKKATAAATKSDGFSAAERAAMKERAQELRAQARGSKKAEEAAAAQLAKIAELPQPDRAMAERIHAIVTASAPHLEPKLWYGMPGYAKDGKILVFFQPASKFDARYSTLGFNDNANLDDGTMWPSAFALTELTADAEARIVELVTKAAS